MSLNQQSQARNILDIGVQSHDVVHLAIREKGAQLPVYVCLLGRRWPCAWGGPVVTVRGVGVSMGFLEEAQPIARV